MNPVDGSMTVENIAKRVLGEAPTDPEFDPVREHAKRLESTLAQAEAESTRHAEQAALHQKGQRDAEAVASACRAGLASLNEPAIGADDGLNCDQRPDSGLRYRE